MRVSRFGSSPLAVVAVLVALAGCQGNLGSGSGLSIPAAQPYGQPGGPGNPAPQTRQRSLDGAVFLTSEMASLPLPTLDGFAISLALGTPPPTPSPTPSGYVAPTPTASASASPRTPRRVKTRALAAPTATTSPAPVPDSSASPLASASSASPTASATANDAANGATSASPAAGSTKRPTPGASPAVPKTVTKLVVYPDDAPAAPTPAPTGSVQSYPVRKALVRGSIKPAADLPLYGLGAVRFTIPSDEDTTGRGYTVAIFAAGKRHHESLVAGDPKATVASHVVASGALDALVLKKNTTYAIVLYADELPATPSPAGVGYPAPGSNPFATPQPGVTATGGTPSGVTSGTGAYPSAPLGASPTPFPR